jgi:hypothetical protein
MFLTLNEVTGLIQYAIRTTASKLGVSDVEWKVTDELLPLIKEKDDKTYDFLITFIEAYSEWFKFHEQIESLGRTGNLNAQETKQLRELIAKRDATREAILKKIKELSNQP